MTKVTFSLQEDKILAVDILGHAGYAEEGEDIVCAAISSAVMLTHAASLQPWLSSAWHVLM